MSDIAIDAVIVSQTSFDSDDEYDVIQSSISFVNYLLEEHFHEDEIAPGAWTSYYVDYYLAQVNNGGFSQFVYNSRWGDQVVGLVRDGLSAMAAAAHLAVFERGAALVAKLGDEGLAAYLDSEYFGDNDLRDELNAINDAFYKTQDTEDLVAVNVAWLRAHPKLVVLEIADMKREIGRRIDEMSDRDERIAKARASEPRYTKLIRALCEEAGQELSHVTAGDPSHERDGQSVMAWHFITDKGHHHFVESGGKAMMFVGDTDECVATIDAPEQL